jgi:hypothetical protein
LQSNQQKISSFLSIFEYKMAPTTFKQYWLPEKKGFDCLTLRHVPKEPPKFGQILVRIKAVSLNWRDGILAIGTYPFPGPDAVVPGSDGAGLLAPDSPTLPLRF